MRQIRRIGAEAPLDAYQKAQRGSLRRVPLAEAAFRELERGRPECIAVDGEAVLVAEPRPGRVDLHYAFADRAAFPRQFPPLFQRLTGLLTLEEAPFGVFFRLTDRAHRPYIEPVLFAQAFEVAREWIRMELPELPAEGSTGEAIASGYQLRPARVDDAALIVELDLAAFPSPVGTVETTASDIQRDHVRVLEDESDGRAAGFLQVHCHYAPTGWIANIALHPGYQRRGLGEALMRWAFAWFREQGTDRAALTVNTDNARAIALYRKLGFAASEIGIDYRRSLDEDEVRQVLEKHRAVHIRVRRRY